MLSLSLFMMNKSGPICLRSCWRHSMVRDIIQMSSENCLDVSDQFVISSLLKREKEGQGSGEASANNSETNLFFSI